jgi:hypothetical protein
MRRLLYIILGLTVGIATIARAQSPVVADHGTARERLIGAWHLANIDSPGPDGKSTGTPRPIGMLIYTADGHISVQLMYPQSAAGLSNEYVLDGYEASFGSFTVDEERHTVTHHIQGSNTGSLLVGKDLPRVFEFTKEGRLIIRSANPEEHWSVTWEHF